MAELSAKRKLFGFSDASWGEISASQTRSRGLRARRDSILGSRSHRCVDASDEVSQGTEGKMKTDEQYVAEFDALFEKHQMWTDQRVMDMFRAEHGSLNEDDVVRLFNHWVKKRKNLA